MATNDTFTPDRLWGLRNEFVRFMTSESFRGFAAGDLETLVQADRVLMAQWMARETEHRAALVSAKRSPHAL